MKTFAPIGLAFLVLLIFWGLAISIGPNPPPVGPTATSTMLLEGSVTPVEALPTQTSTVVPTATPQPPPEPTATPVLPPQPLSKLAVDVSNYWAVNPVSHDDAAAYVQKFINAGFFHLIAGTQWPSITQQQLVEAQAAGMSTDIYVELNTNSDLNAEMDQALWARGDVPTTATWIAFELPPPAGWTADQWVQAGLDAAVAHGMPNVGIYTAAWWWNYWIKDSSQFSGWPLWYANYNGLPFIDWDNERFGAWEWPTMKQYAGSTTKLNTVSALIAQTYGYVPFTIPLRPMEPADPPNVDLNIRQ